MILIGFLGVRYLFVFLFYWQKPIHSRKKSLGVRIYVFLNAWKRLISLIFTSLILHTFRLAPNFVSTFFATSSHSNRNKWALFFTINAHRNITLLAITRPFFYLFRSSPLPLCILSLDSLLSEKKNHSLAIKYRSNKRIEAWNVCELTLVSMWPTEERKNVIKVFVLKLHLHDYLY